MLTIFSTPKAFRGHFGVIQRNALKSWTLLHPDVEVILFGREEGAAEVARELGIRHEPDVERNEFGTNRLDCMFRRANEIARHDLMCYSNCDIVLTDDFANAAKRASAQHRDFLMVGRRWDTPITEPIDYSDGDWAREVRERAFAAHNQRNRWFIDYFVFRRGHCREDMPAFAVGRVGWDNWMIWKALDAGMAVVDASRFVAAVHQNHDYSHLAKGEQTLWKGDEAKRNRELAGGWGHLRNISDATFAMGRSGKIRSRWPENAAAKAGKFVANLPQRAWYGLLKLSYVPRHAMGLSRPGLAQANAKGPDRKGSE